MFDLDRWQEIWFTITHNKSRSFLTAFGVFWGMFMLVVMVGAGVALQRGMSSQIEGFATNSCFVWADQTTEPYKGFKKGRNWNMENEDIGILLNKVPEIQYLAPVLFGGGTPNNVTRNDKAGSYGVKGNYPSYNLIDASKMIYGRYINDIDITEKRKVCVIGERVYQVLFPKDENPLGKNIQVNGIYFQVVGVARHTSSINIGGNAEESVVLPFSTMQQAFNQGNKVHFMAVTAKPGIKVKVIEDQIHDVLKAKHNISPIDKKAVGEFNIEDEFNMFLYLGIGIAALIWIVGLGTLFAGAVGVSNIMLVTVRERTKEIGIRRALGATPRDIIGQILSESIVLTLIAGVSGLVFGVGILSLVGMALSHGDQFFKDPQISFSVAAASLLILLIIGTLAGFIPANRAMNIKPIEAIREE
ncbi:MAG: ABC transporter permease [Bacteroidota bacterium]|nr:ABC transporter permease [Bacteroidota bacterium]